MKREEAERHIGKLVITSFVSGAKYFGELVEIIPSKPFRAIVKICGVQEYPNLYCHNTNGSFIDYRIEKGPGLIKDEGTLVETGNSIELYTGEKLSYQESLIIAIENYLNETNQTIDEYSKNSRHYTCWINNLKDCEKLRDILQSRLNEAKNDI